MQMAETTVKSEDVTLWPVTLWPGMEEHLARKMA